MPSANAPSASVTRGCWSGCGGNAYETAGSRDLAGAADDRRQQSRGVGLFLAIVLRGVGHSIVIPRDDL
jgi:hypothetical protein